MDSSTPTPHQATGRRGSTGNRSAEPYVCPGCFAKFNNRKAVWRHRTKSGGCASVDGRTLAAKATSRQRDTQEDVFDPVPFIWIWRLQTTSARSPRETAYQIQLRMMARHAKEYRNSPHLLKMHRQEQLLIGTSTSTVLLGWTILLCVLANLPACPRPIHSMKCNGPLLPFA